MNALALVAAASDIYATKLYYVAAATLIFYDYFLTFPAEIEFSWKQKKTLVNLLFLLNRYVNIGFTIVVLLSYFAPFWIKPTCERYIISEFAHTVFTFTIAEIFLALRVYVLTSKNKLLTCVLILHILAQLGLAIFIFSQKGSASAPPLPEQIISKLHDKSAFQFCQLFPPVGVLNFDIAYLCLALSFDAIVFGATLVATWTASRTYIPLRWIQVIQRDGVIYFMAIFSSTLMWTLLILHAENGLRLINAEPDVIFTSIMINRLYLSLKEAGKSHQVSLGTNGQVALAMVVPHSNSSIG